MTRQDNAVHQGYQRLLKSKSEFPRIMLEVHASSIEYDMRTYVSSKTKIMCLCTEKHCKCIWWATPSMLIRGGGCPACSSRLKMERMHLLNNLAISIARDSIVERLQSTHNGNISIVNKDDYIGNRHSINFVCNTCSHVWKAKPSNILWGSGCPVCASSGFKIKEPAILYLLDLGDNLYKIGITNRSIKDRYSISDQNKIVRSFEKYYELGELALSEETRLKREYKDFRYIGPNILESGNTEIFTINLFVVGGVLF